MGSAPLASAHIEAEFFEKLAKLEQTVRAGDHPRIKLPKQAFTASAQTNNVNGHAASKAPTVSGPSDATPAADPKSFSTTSQGSGPVHNAAVDSSSSFPYAVGEAEESSLEAVGSRRERIERELKEALTRHKASVRNHFSNGMPWDGPNDVNAGQILDAALEIVKPSQQSKSIHADNDESSNSAASISDSVFYSSKVDSLSGDGSHHSSEAHSTVGQALGKDGQDKDVNKEPKASDLAASMNSMSLMVIDLGSDIPRQILSIKGLGIASLMHPLLYLGAEVDHPVLTTPMEIDAIPSATSEPYQQTSHELPTVDSRDQGASKKVPKAAKGAGTEQRTRESESYSPPSLPVPLVQNRVSASATQQFPPAASRPPNRRLQMSVPTTSHGSHAPTAPTAPTASNTATLRKNFASGNRPGEGRARARQNNQAPAISESDASRKRRRETDQTEVRRDRLGKRTRTRQSPEPSIKLEPQSPPSLTTRPQATRPQASRPQQPHSPSRTLVMRDDGTAELRSGPEQPEMNLNVNKRNQPPAFEPRSGEFQQGEETAQTQRFVDRRNVSSPSVVQEQVNGQAGSHRFSNARPPLGGPPGLSYDSRRPIYIDEEEPLHVTSPRLVARRPTFPAMASYYDSEDSRVYHERRAERYALPVDQNEAYLPRRLDNPEFMPPPPKRRVIIDENGDEWVAVPTRRSVRGSIAREVPLDEPRQYTTLASAQFVEEPLRRRLEPQVIDLEHDDRYARMVPPPPVYREPARSRAASAMPTPTRDDSQYRQVPNTPTHVVREELDRPRNRAYTARPAHAAQPAYASNPRYGYISDGAPW
ncbi:MAG: hypothetical protein M1831_004447 [Alyxoria varia]|nr:MAG: hypothetical protein M1831_004447 [Alyxoria varia]